MHEQASDRSPPALRRKATTPLPPGEDRGKQELGARTIEDGRRAAETPWPGPPQPMLAAVEDNDVGVKDGDTVVAALRRGHPPRSENSVSTYKPLRHERLVSIG